MTISSCWLRHDLNGLALNAALPGRCSAIKGLHNCSRARDSPPKDRLPPDALSSAADAVIDCQRPRPAATSFIKSLERRRRARHVFASRGGSTEPDRNVATLIARHGPILNVRGLDCLDGTSLIDLKPDRCRFTPLAPPLPGDFETV